MRHLARCVVFLNLLCCGSFWVRAEEAPKRPEHDVLLEEDETVDVLLRKARVAAARGAENPEAWPAFF